MKLSPGFEKRVVAAAAKWVPMWFRTSRASSQDSLPWLSSRRLFSRDDRKCPGLPTRRRVHLQSPPPACACVRAPGPPSPHDPRTIAARGNENLYCSQLSCRQLTSLSTEQKERPWRRMNLFVNKWKTKARTQIRRGTQLTSTKFLRY
jgi:hypothetical protein